MFQSKNTLALQAQTRVYYTQVQGLTIEVYETKTSRTLYFGNTVVQSAMWLAEPSALILSYAQSMAGILLFQPSPSKALHIGLGGGCLPRFLHQHCPALQQTIVELNQGVVEVADQFFPLPFTPHISVVIEDGGTFLARTQTQYDMMLVDAFLANGTPEHLLALETLQHMAKCLTSTGWLAINAWGSQTSRLRKLQHMLRGIFGKVSCLPARADSNVILFCTGLKSNVPSKALLQHRAMLWQERTGLPFASFPKTIYEL